MAALSPPPQIVGEGVTNEAQWTDWLRELRPPPLAMGAVLGTARRLVVVCPHPDDDVLACGGLLALHAAKKGACLVVAVTDGEASHQGDPTWTLDQVGQARRLEHQRGLARLGVDVRADHATAVTALSTQWDVAASVGTATEMPSAATVGDPASALIRLGLPDGQVAAHSSRLEQVLSALLEPEDCVVSTWSLDGHPDHEATGAATARVCRRVQCHLLQAPVWMWHWAVPGDSRVPWHRLYALPLPAEPLALKNAALAEHVSQLAPRGQEPAVLGSAVRARAWRAAEYFFL